LIEAGQGAEKRKYGVYISSGLESNQK